MNLIFIVTEVDLIFHFKYWSFIQYFANFYKKLIIDNLLYEFILSLIFINQNTLYFFKYFLYISNFVYYYLTNLKCLFLYLQTFSIQNK